MLFQVIEFLRARLEGDEGATMVEYGLMVAGIAIVVAAAAFTLGLGIETLFGTAETCVGGGACP